MAPAQVFKVYIWLVDTIASGRLSKEDIDRRWAHSSINDYGESTFPLRKFHRYKEDILTLFGISIKCNRRGNYYYIEGEGSNLQWGQMRNWIVSAFAMKATIDEAQNIEDRIILEDIPAGTQYLTTIMRNIRSHKQLLVSYRNFDREADYDMFFSPYCLKVFKQRWYMVGEASTHPGEIRIYALDRISDLHSLDTDFAVPATFSAEHFFAPYYGVFTTEAPCLVRIETTPRAAKFLRSLPLHASQKELSDAEGKQWQKMAEGVVFEYYVAPTFDLIQQFRTFGAELRVIAPLTVAEKMYAEAQQVAALYL